MEVKLIKGDTFEQVQVRQKGSTPDPRVAGPKIIFDSRLDKMSHSEIIKKKQQESPPYTLDDKKKILVKMLSSNKKKAEKETTEEQQVSSEPSQ